MMQDRIIAALDIGSTKIVAIIGQQNGDGKIKILGLSKASSIGVKKGVVLNVEETVKAIQSTVEEVEKISGVIISDVFVGITGRHIVSLKTRGYINRDSSEEEIKQDEVLKLIGDLNNINLNIGEKMIQITPLIFTIDSNIVANNPIGKYGKRLEAESHVIAGQISIIKKIEKCLCWAKLTTKDLIFGPIASANAVLTKYEKDVGVVIVDIGGGTTGLAVYYDSIIRHIAVIPFGGNDITIDIKEEFSILRSHAEQLKIQFGLAFEEGDPEDKVVVVPGIKGRSPKEISFKRLSYIIQSRMEKIIDIVNFEIQKSGYSNKLAAGMVITGGGAMLKHLPQFINFKTAMDVRIGLPNEYVSGSSRNEINQPIYASSVGLIIYGFEHLGAFKKSLNTIRKEKFARRFSGVDSSMFENEKAEKQRKAENTLKEKKVSLIEHLKHKLYNFFQDEVADNEIDNNGDQQSASVFEVRRPTIENDKVYFSASYPPIVMPKQRFILDVWAYLYKDRREVINMIQQTKSPDDFGIIRPGTPLFNVIRGSTLILSLNIQDIVKKNDKLLLWDGEIENTSFVIEIPPEATVGEKFGSVTIRCWEGLQVAKIEIKIIVVKEANNTKKIIQNSLEIQNAFASYSSSDRDEVLSRIQGMQKIRPDLNVYIDVLKLRSGQDWESELWRVIPQNDIFYLFWSAAAKESKWVEKEWRCALKSKGKEFIDPVPLVSPEEVLPPEELRSIHFNDWTVAFKRGRPLNDQSNY